MRMVGGIRRGWPAPSRTWFFARALAELRSAGCRRVALTVPELPAAWEAAFNEELARRQLVTRPYWHQCVPLSDTACARRITHLLFAATPGDRPDGLIIADDNLVEAAEAGLMDAGVCVPEDARVIAQCNFPWPTPSPLPVRRLGFDMHTLLRHALAILGDVTTTQVATRADRVQAVFAEETAARPA